MQNLSFQVTQPMPAKPTNMSNQEATNAATQEPNVSFKEMLNNEVKSKQARIDQEKASQARLDERARLQEKKLDQSAVSQSQVATTPPVTDAPKVDLAEQDTTQKSDHDAVIDQVVFADAAAKQLADAEKAQQIAVQPTTSAGKPEVTVNELAAPIGLPTTSTIEASQADAVAANNTNIADVSSARRAAVNADARADLSQLKKGIAEPKEVIGKDVKAEVDNTAELKDWVDTVLPNSAKPQATTPDSQLKTAASAMRDALPKDSGLSATGIQAAATLNTQQTNALQPAQAASANLISAYPGKTGWNEAIGQKIVYMVGAAEQSATLTLNPPDMGPLQVVIHVHNDQADATFISDNSEVRRVLEDGLSNLKDMLNQSGINLGQANIGSGSQQQEFAEMARVRSQTRAESAGVTAQESTPKTVTVQRTSNGLVDTFV